MLAGSHPVHSWAPIPRNEAEPVRVALMPFNHQGEMEGRSFVRREQAFSAGKTNQIEKFPNRMLQLPAQDDGDPVRGT